MITCFRCAKIIKGEIIRTNAPGDFPKSFHLSCYKKEEKEAERELICNFFFKRRKKMKNGNSYTGKQILGYRNGFEYISIGQDVYRRDYADDHEPYHWYTTVEGMEREKKTLGSLFDENGNRIPFSMAGKLP